MIEHTKEPWSQAYRKGEDGMYRQEIFDSAGRVIAFLAWYPVKIDDRTTTTNREDKARRIVACVNACAGIPLERLEQMPPINAAKDWVDTVLQWKDQRDELLAATANALAALVTLNDNRAGLCNVIQEIDQLRAAIAKVQK